jgi:hypothetical protein
MNKKGLSRAGEPGAHLLKGIVAINSISDDN